MQYVLLSLCLVVLLFVSFFWSYPFYKSLNRLQKQAIKIGEGKFDEKIKLSKTSALMPLNHALNQMADQLQLLIYSHKSLTNAIAHEIKTPLARMRFALELLKAETKSEIIDDLDYDIEDLDQLVNTLLLNAKLDRKGLVLQKEKVNLSEMLFTDMVQYKKRYPKKKWQAEIEDNIYLLIDQKMFNRGVNNLLINAYNYSKAIIKLSLKKENNLIILSISDDGLGIDEKNYQRIFEPFERVDQARSNHQVKGHGLGLAITKKVVEAHLGEIEVTRSKLGGAKFVIYLKDEKF